MSSQSIRITNCFKKIQLLIKDYGNIGWQVHDLVWKGALKSNEGCTQWYILAHLMIYMLDRRALRAQGGWG
jgi:hypothetical protein